MPTAVTPRPPMTPYIRIIMEEFNLEHLAAYRVEQTIRDMPGCGTLDHLTRDAIIRLARTAIRTSP
jgi:hypothetical protein